MPHDTVVKELKKVGEMSGENLEDQAMAIAVYMLGFSSYTGFSSLIGKTLDKEEALLKRIYAYAKDIDK